MTPQQSKVLIFIKDYWMKNNYAPSYQDIMEKLNYKSSMVVNRHVYALAERGYITHLPRKRRSIELTQKGAKYGTNDG